MELFKQAVSEGLSNKLDSVANGYTDEIVYSDKHKLAMRTIVYGKVDTKIAWTPKMKRIIAILIAAALLLTSCGIIFRNEIREVFEKFFVQLSYSEDENGVDRIEDVYELTYLPEGYTLQEEKIRTVKVNYTFTNGNGDIIRFEQKVLNGSNFVVDSECGYSKMFEIEEYDIYYRFTDTYHCYIWSDGTYSMKLKATQKFSNEDTVLILNGIKIK